METKELLLMAEAIANAKSIDKDLVFKALEESIAIATKKQTGWNIKVIFDKDTASFKTYRLWQVIADGENFVDDEGTEFDPELHIYKKDSADVEIDDFISEEIPPMNFNRIGAQTVKQAITQKVREAERNSIINKYQTKIGEVISCVVKRLSKGNVIIDLGGMDGVINKNELIPGEPIRKGDRIKVLVKEIKEGPRGNQIIFSRSDDMMLKALFSIEVPEIAEGAIEVMACSRDAGVRSKMAIKARDRRIDAKGSCIGMRGTRIGAVSNELSGEKIDIVEWSAEPVDFVINAIAPAEVSSIVVNENSKSMDLAFADEELAKAIGRAGQNIRLASNLTGWSLNAISIDEAEKSREDELGKIIDKLSSNLDIDKQTAEVLIGSGFDNIDTIAEADTDKLAAIDGMDITMADELKSRAVDAGLVLALNNADTIEVFTDIDGLDNNLANALIDNDISTLEDLAELSTHELRDIYTIDKEDAAKIILTAREKEGWFN